jgi:hypothetical protein
MADGCFVFVCDASPWSQTSSIVEVNNDERRAVGAEKGKRTQLSRKSLCSSGPGIRGIGPGSPGSCGRAAPCASMFL